MIHLRQIHTSDPAYPFVEELLLTAFPEDERREMPEQRHNTDRNSVFHCMLAQEDTQPIGFFTYWDFGSFCYGEHFAIDPSMRNHGYGGQILSAVLAHIRRPLVIEVEMPDCSLSQRRIGFYQRNGLRLWEQYPYIQPAYRPNGNALPMLLMASAELKPEQQFDDVVRTIHQQVYGYHNDN